MQPVPEWQKPNLRRLLKKNGMKNIIAALAELSSQEADYWRGYGNSEEKIRAWENAAFRLESVNEPVWPCDDCLQ